MLINIFLIYFYILFFFFVICTVLKENFKRKRSWLNFKIDFVLFLLCAWHKSSFREKAEHSWKSIQRFIWRIDYFNGRCRNLVSGTEPFSEFFNLVKKNRSQQFLRYARRKKMLSLCSWNKWMVVSLFSTIFHTRFEFFISEQN